LAKEIALGYVRRPFPPSGGFRLDALDPENPYSAPAVRVETVDLPFVRWTHRSDPERRFHRCCLSFLYRSSVRWAENH